MTAAVKEALTTAGGRWLVYLRWTALVILPAVLATLTGFAFVSEGEARVVLIFGVVTSALVLAFLQVYGEIQAWRANRESVSARVTLATSLNGAGRPLVTLMGRVAEARTEDRRAEVMVLVSKIGGIAHSQCGKLVENPGKTRCVIYLFTSERVLSRLYEEGRQGRAARRTFVEGRTDNETEVIRVARGEDSLLVADIKDTPPKHYADYVGREYQCFLMVPIRTNKRSYGFLAVDSDRPYTLTKVDIGFATLMAYLLGSALALLGEEYPRLGSLDSEDQGPESGVTEEGTEAV